MRSPRLIAVAGVLVGAVVLAAPPAAASTVSSAAPARATVSAPARITSIGRPAAVTSGRRPAWTHERNHSGIFNATSTNWSGYAVTGTYGAVHGSWVVPAPTCNTGNTFSSFWVGLNGWSNTTVQQLGTETDCTSTGASYYAWWEMYPSASQILSTTTYPVHAGDVITASVLTNIGVYALQMSSSRGWSVFINAAGPTSVVSAEWIAEAPSGSFGPLPLTDFGTVSFSNCTTNNNTPISASPGFPITMQLTKRMPSGEIGTLVEAQPSNLNAAGTGFTDQAFPFGHRYQL